MSFTKITGRHKRRRRPVQAEGRQEVFDLEDLRARVEAADGMGNHVVELFQIARPWQRGEQRQGRWRERARRQPRGHRDVLQHSNRERRHVVFPFAQWRHVDRNSRRCHSRCGQLASAHRLRRGEKIGIS